MEVYPMKVLCAGKKPPCDSLGQPLGSSAQPRGQVLEAEGQVQTLAQPRISVTGKTTQCNSASIRDHVETGEPKGPHERKSFSLLCFFSGFYSC